MNATPMGEQVGLADIVAAREVLEGVTVTTPMEESRWLSSLVGGPVWLKCENLQRTGSFKARGAFVRISRLFWLWTLISLLLPALLGALLTWSWQGALTGFFWGSLVRVALLHHVTWSINSICHTIGERPFLSRDKSANVWWLAIPSMGESWHNLHHADPTCARHGVLRGQVDVSARVIWLLEKLGWVHDVRWPVRSRVQSKLV